MRLKPTIGQRWRVSVYAPGVNAGVPKDYPLVHKASREQATAQKHYDQYARQIGDGKIGRVIMHQGKLYTGSSQYIHDDTKWWPDKYPQNDQAQAQPPTATPGRNQHGC